jgi:hypothetical protein
MEVLSLFLLVREDIIAQARAMARAGHPMRHAYEPGSAQACTFERAYHEQRRELDAQQAELV